MGEIVETLGQNILGGPNDLATVFHIWIDFKIRKEIS